MQKTQPLAPTFFVPAIVFAALVLVPPLCLMMGEPFIISVVTRFMIYALAALGLNVALGYGGLVSFGHSLFFGLGVYVVGISSFYGISSFFLHILFTLTVVGIVSVVTGAISLRTTGVAFIMITLAFAQLGYFFFVSLYKFGGSNGMTITHTSHIAGFDLSSPMVLYAAVFIVLSTVTVISARLRESPFGMVVRGARQNSRRISTFGLPVFRYRLACYMLSAMITSIAGVFLANLTAYASPSTLAWPVSGDLIVMVVLGGMDTVFGPIYGALTYLFLQEILKAHTVHWMAVLGPFIVVIGLWGTGGLAGLLERLNRRLVGTETAGVEGK